MKEFIKFMFASFLGTLLTVLVLMVIMFGMIAGLASMTEKEEVKLKSNTVLQINWKTPIYDRASENPFEQFDFSTLQSNRPLGLNVILKNIEKAKNDPDVDGIFLNMEEIQAGVSTIEEIRNKLLEFKKTGKFIVSYANGYDQKAYYLASLSDEIYMNPDGFILFKGLNAQLFFLKKMLDKLDIGIQVIRGPDNKYKSAVEPLIYEKMSDANREQLETLLNSIWGKLILDISKSRGISIEELNKAADNLDLVSAEKAVELNFIDGLMYEDELMDKLKEKTGRVGDSKLRSVTFGKYTNVKSRKKRKITSDGIAVVYAQGDIIQGKGVPNTIGSETMARALRQARENDRVKAIVFRVNSPGGDALASEVIRREVVLAKKEKPVIVSMGDVAASGGYWISVSADYIFAEPTTITGSIGVFGIIPNFKGLFNDKLGITFDNVKTNKNADFVDVMKPLSDYQYKKIDEEITKIYNKFVNLVSTSRNLGAEYVDGIARGRVWAGSDALKLGLVDQIGGLDDAIAYAAEKAELGENYRIREYPVRKPFYQQIIEELQGDAKARIIGNELGDFKTYYDQIQTLRRMKGIQARLPFIYKID
ncbi:MAG: signal peptide peptidase SppA [Chlorobi bacterium]|nr:signal peptide peptidase SppA [Chlorobiota bacterium]